MVIPALQLKDKLPWTLLLSCKTGSGILDRQKNQICIGLSGLLPIPFIGAVPRSCFINGPIPQDSDGFLYINQSKIRGYMSG